MKNEIWKPVVGYEGLYEVSNIGRVRRCLCDGTYRMRKIRIGSRNYYELILSKNGNIRLWNVHRLVALAFIPNPHKLPQVNHKDGNRLNNDVSNLEWVTARDNQLHSRRVLHNAVQPVLCVEKKIVFPSIAIASENTGASISHIFKVIKNLRSTAGGYHWVPIYDLARVERMDFIKTWQKEHEKGEIIAQNDKIV